MYIEMRYYRADEVTHLDHHNKTRGQLVNWLDSQLVKRIAVQKQFLSTNNRFDYKTSHERTCQLREKWKDERNTQIVHFVYSARISSWVWLKSFHGFQKMQVLGQEALSNEEHSGKVPKHELLFEALFQRTFGIHWTDHFAAKLECIL